MAELVAIPRSTLQKLEKFMEAFTEQKEEYINESEAAKFLGIGTRRLQNMVSNKTIKTSAYRLSVTGKRMYKKSRLLLEDLSK